MADNNALLFGLAVGSMSAYCSSENVLTYMVYVFGSFCLSLLCFACVIFFLVIVKNKWHLSNRTLNLEPFFCKFFAIRKQKIKSVCSRDKLINN